MPDRKKERILGLRKLVKDKFKDEKTRPQYFWVGVKAKSNGEYGWTTRYDYNITWAVGHPKANADCGIISTQNGKIYSTSCDKKLPYICFTTDEEFKQEAALNKFYSQKPKENYTLIIVAVILSLVVFCGTICCCCCCKKKDENPGTIVPDHSTNASHSGDVSSASNAGAISKFR